jgi:glycolate oxidase FAD binding subunit
LIEPDNEDALIAAIGQTLADGRSLKIMGGGTKDGFGRPVVSDGQLSLGRLEGINFYDPGELVLEAEAGTPLAEIEALLAENGQQLAFEPPDFSLLYHAPVGRGTIGGAIACNLAGPRRPFAGAARDHVLGIRAVSGRGEVFASGGRVVKNVTGYDMSKLLTGSFGTLAVLSRVTLKVLPRADAIRTVLLFGLGPEEATAKMAEVTVGGWDISAAAHVPGTLAGRSRVNYVAAARSVTAFRIEGSRAGAAVRTESLRQALGAAGETEELHTSNSVTFWKEIGGAALLPKGQGTLWRMSLPPAEGGAMAEKIHDAMGGESLIDWAGGLLWLFLAEEAGDEDTPALASRLRTMAEAHGGHATLVRAPFETRYQVPVFHPLAKPLAALTRRIKENFDPQGVLNPGRMFEGV